MLRINSKWQIERKNIWKKHDIYSYYLYEEFIKKIKKTTKKIPRKVWTIYKEISKHKNGENINNKVQL